MELSTHCHYASLCTTPQVHRAFMIASWFVAVCAFIIIFVANRNQDPPGLINTDDVSV